MAIVNPYLTFLGTCEEAFNHYKSIFGGEFTYMGRFNEMPPQEGAPAMSEEEGNKIMHVSLPMEDGTALIGSDTGGEWANNIVVGNNVTLSITAKSKEEADLMFNALANGGQVAMPMTQQFWGDYFGMCTDKYGINWMMSFNENAK